MSHAGIDNLAHQVAELNKTIKSMQTDLTDLKVSVNDLTVTNGDFDTRLKRISDRLDEMDTALDYKAKYAEMLSKFDSLHKRMISLESQSRRNNLLIDGLDEAGSTENCLEKVYNFLEKDLKIADARQIRIERAHRLGAPPVVRPGSVPQIRPRAMIFKLLWYGDRQRIWKAKGELANTGLFLKEDFPKEIISGRTPLFPLKHADVDSFDKLPKDIDPRFASTKQTESEFVFFGSLCPLSNFHDSPFLLDNKIFKWVEQYFTYKRAEIAKDEPSMKRIMDACTPLECKRLGKNVKLDLKTWKKHQETVMARALRAKFTQNPELKDYLVATGGRTLAESSPSDRFWGTGVGLRQENATKQQYWMGKNKLGQMLMNLRNDFL
jgi:ribA/ribD-fused uncharacterized protein